ncbi:MAG: hypothetical protein ABEJ42_09070 [Halobacteriaceae archaeon]
MSDEEPVPTDRESPVGRPVIRGDEAVAGERAREAVSFDPDDPESVERAAETARSFAAEATGAEDSIYMLRGAAACAALVRAEGSYKGAAARAGDPVTVPFIRKWARVHDLPRAVRSHVARGDIPPTAAKHIARVGGADRYALAWAVLDGDLTVREVRAIASEVNDGRSAASALAERGVTPGEITLVLDREQYHELRRRSAVEGTSPGDVVNRALAAYFED